VSGWWAHPVTTLAFCWRIDRRDGVSLGFTSHDRDIVRDGLVYRASPGMTPSAISLSDGFDVDTLDVSGALTGDAISDADLADGRWDGAALRLFAVDWADPAGADLYLARGTLGTVEVRDRGFTAALSGPTAVLAEAVVEETSPTCRADLGDKRCRVNMAARVRSARVTDWTPPTLTIDVAEPSPNAFGFGRLRWIEGPNSGLASLIAGSDGNRLVLRDPPPNLPRAGEMIELAEGCDRTLATCAARFGNAENFRGEPFLPGADLLTRYPGA
jgi:uncharacterized phage protein (TIGR02218 family)